MLTCTVLQALQDVKLSSVTCTNGHAQWLLPVPCIITAAAAGGRGGACHGRQGVQVVDQPGSRLPHSSSMLAPSVVPHLHDVDDGAVEQVMEDQPKASERVNIEVDVAQELHHPNIINTLAYGNREVSLTVVRAPCSRSKLSCGQA